MRIGTIYAALSALFLLSAQSSASDEASLRFDALGKMFDSGRSFEFSKSTGWYAGRCWRPYSDNAQNGVLIMQQRKLDGPGFPLVQKFSVYQFADRSPRYFDKLPKPRSDQEKHRNLPKLWSEIVAADFSSDWTQLGQMHKRGESYTIAFTNLPTMSLRRSSDNKYFVVKKGESLNCYFFKKLVQKQRADS